MEQKTEEQKTEEQKTEEQKTEEKPRDKGEGGWRLPSPEWEAIVGGKWALWIGVASLFLALALFLSYTWRSLPPAPPWARFALGMGAGAALLGGASWARGRAQAWFCEGLCGAGLAALYLSLWAGSQAMHLFALPIAFGAMVLVTALGVALALRDDAPGLSIVAAVGGFCTPLVLQASGEGASSPLGLGLYVAILDAGIVAASLWKRWRSLTWLAFAATITLIGGWSANAWSANAWGTEGLRPEHRALVLGFGYVYWIGFTLAACFYSLRRRESTAPADLLLFFASAGAFALCASVLLGAPHESPSAALPLSLCAGYGMLAWTVKSLAPGNRTLRDSALGLSLLFLTIAGALGLGQDALGVAWAAQAGVLLVLADRYADKVLRRAGQAVWAMCAWLVLSKPGHIFDAQWLSVTAFVLATALVAWQLRPSVREAACASRDEFASLYPIAAVWGSAWLAARAAWGSTALFGASDALAASVAVALVASVAFWAGARLKWLEVRASALALGALSFAASLLCAVSMPAMNAAPFWNGRWAALLTVAACGCAMAWLAARVLARGEKCEEKCDESEAMALRWAPASAALFVLLALSLETWLAFGSGHHVRAALALSVEWAVGASALCLWPWARRQDSMRHMSRWIGGASVSMLLAVSLGSVEATSTWAPILNPRALAFGLVLGSLALAVVSLRRDCEEGERGEIEARAITIGGALLVCGASIEIFQAAQARSAAWLALSMLWHVGALFFLRQSLARKNEEMRVAAWALGAVAGAALLWASGEARADWAPLLNVRFGAFVIAIGVALLARRELSRSQVLGGERSDHLTRLVLWAAALAWWGLSREVWEGAWALRQVLGGSAERAAQTGLSLAWALLGAAWLAIGTRAGVRELRLLALALLALTVGKVLVLDLGFLPGAWRVASLAGVGAALVFISWLYSRARPA